MRTLTLISLLFLVSLPSHLWAYGYEQNEDPILKVFKAVIYYGKASEARSWQKIGATRPRPHRHWASPSRHFTIK